MRRRNRTILFLVLSLAMLLIAGLLFYRHYHLTPPTSTEADYPPASQPVDGRQPLSSVPAKSRRRAMTAGYYCPSWDTPPGQVSVTICYPVYDDTAL